MNLKLIFVTAVTLIGLQVFAGECEMTVTRTACPGKQDEALAPYSKVNPTVEKKASANSNSCVDQAKKACRIIRKGTLTRKDITAKFDGAAVEGGKNICDAVSDSKKECK